MLLSFVLGLKAIKFKKINMPITEMRKASQTREGNEIGNRKKGDINFISAVLFYDFNKI